MDLSFLRWIIFSEDSKDVSNRLQGQKDHSTDTPTWQELPGE